MSKTSLSGGIEPPLARYPLYPIRGTYINLSKLRAKWYLRDLALMKLVVGKKGSGMHRIGCHFGALH